MAARTKPQLHVPDYLLENAREIFRNCDKPERARAYTSITLRRRFRGVSKSDLFGLFDAGANGTGGWIGDSGEVDNFDLYSFQIVKSVIRANLNALVQSKVECTIEARAKNKSSLAGAAGVAKGVYQYINNHCFVAGTMILMADGTEKSIENVRVGDQIISHTGAIRSVTETFVHPFRGQLRVIKRLGDHRVLEVSSEHPFYAMVPVTTCACGCGTRLNRRDRKAACHRFQDYVRGHGSRTRKNAKPDYGWVSAAFLEKGDFLSTPRLLGDVEAAGVTPGKARLLGYYLAEGYYHRQKPHRVSRSYRAALSSNDGGSIPMSVSFALNLDETDTLVLEIRSLLRDEFGVGSSVQRVSANGVVVHSQQSLELVQFFKEHATEYARSKKVATEVLRWPVHLQREVVRGWIEGDGCVQSSAGGWVSVTSASADLISQMHILFNRLGVFATRQTSRAVGRKRVRVANGTVQVVDDPTKECVSHRLLVGSVHAENLLGGSFLEPLFRRSIRNRKKHSLGFRVRDDRAMFPIRSVGKKTYEGKVYNFETEVDHSYVANGVAVHNSDYWSNNFVSQTQQQIQTDYGCFVHTYHDPDAESPIKLKLQDWANQPQEQPGNYVCAHCGAEGPLFSEQMGQATDDGTMPCIKCGETAEIETLPEMADVPQFQSTQEYPAGNTIQDVISAYQIRVDERKTKNGNIRKARWLDHHYLMEEDDLQAEVPYFELTTPMEWSFPTKWEHCLETGSDLYLKPWSANLMSDGRRPQHEVRRIYMRPEWYRHYVAPQDYDMDRGDGQMALNREGNPMLSIKAGQKLIDIYPDGFWYLVANDQLLPSADACNLLDEWAYMYYMNDSASFHGQPASELNELARAADNFWTIVVQHLESSSISTLVADRNFFNLEDFEKQLALTREGKHIETGDDINRHFGSVTPPPMNGAMQGIEFIRGIVGDVGGPQPAMVGDAQPGVAYATVALQREQSLGQLTTALQSMAECKASVVVQHLKLAQRTRPDEWFQHIRTLYGEEWKDQDIQAFLDCDVDLDLDVGYKETSVQPQSIVQREMKLRAVIMDLANIAKAIGKPELLTPELLAQYGEVSGIEFDIADTASEERLTDIRYRKIQKLLAEKQDDGLPEDALVAEVMADPLFIPLPREDHLVAIEWLTDHSIALLGEDHPNFALVKCCLALIKLHEEAGVKQAQTDDANALEGKAPSAAAALAASQAQGAAAGQAAQAKAQADDQMKQMELQAKAEQLRQQQQHDAIQSEAERQHVAADAEAERQHVMQNAEAEREHVASQKEADVALKAAELAASHPDGQHPQEKIGESMNYKDLPPAAQAKMLEQVDLPSTGTKEVHAATLAKATAAKAAASNGGKPKSSARPLA
jgi:hypothetical protein